MQKHPKNTQKVAKTHTGNIGGIRDAFQSWFELGQPKNCLGQVGLGLCSIVSKSIGGKQKLCLDVFLIASLSMEVCFQLHLSRYLHCIA